MERLRTVLFLLGVVLLVFSINPERALSEVDVHIGIGLPTLVISAPPVMVVIPGTYAYYSPDIEAELVFYHGYWYRPYGGLWYRATIYNGPWVRIGVSSVPVVIRNLPPGYRSNIPPGHQRIPYGQVKQNWKAWERDKHWDKPSAGSKGGGPSMKEPKGGGGPKMKEMKEPKGSGKGGKGKGKFDD